MATQDVSQSTNTHALIACLCVAVVVMAARSIARWYKMRRAPLDSEDLFMYLAIVAFAITTALYLDTMPTFFGLREVEAGTRPPYPSLESDLNRMLKEFFVVQFFFWLTLWAVKWSLLFMFKRLTQGLHVFNIIWWSVFVFSVLLFLACCVSNFTSCSSMDAWFTAGQCNTPKDVKAKLISLWFSLGADLLTDVMIMVTPLHVLWNLKMSLAEKLSVGLVFCVGVITMATAIVRTVTLDSSVSGGIVSTTWLILWAAIEGVVAIITGCLPSFAIFLRHRVTTSRNQYQGSSDMHSSGYHSRSKSSRGPPGSLRLGDDDFAPWQSTDGASDKGLVPGGITVTRSFSQKWHTADGVHHERRGNGIDTDYELDAMHRQH